MIYKNEILDLKTDITEKIGQKIIVKGSLGRTKSFEKEATIEKTYPNIFVIKYEEDDRNVTYSYTDILTRTVEVEVFDGVGYSPLIPPYQKEKSKRIRCCHFWLWPFILWTSYYVKLLKCHFR